ncbi:MAG: hypothetical protein OJF60_002304 [Burkholderiaceae bacterium]|jgi:predicted dinucleotide-binding enzyme|nr:MAG: hypothetical protein OJF60_002304 [Burkholderiaceae bacterium]
MRVDRFFDLRRRRLLLAGGVTALVAALAPRRAAGADKIPIGVIGSGHIGGTVGGLWAQDGHPVLFSSRHPEELGDLVRRLGPLARAGTVEQAIAFGDALLVAVPYKALPQLGQDYAPMLRGKIVLDACNAIAARDGAIADEVEQDGIGVTSQKYLAGTRLVRAFNTMSSTILAREANRPAPRMAIPIAGDDADAVSVAAQLVRDAGFEPVVVGTLADARRFQRGGPGYGQSVTTPELRRALSLPP